MISSASICSVEITIVLAFIIKLSGLCSVIYSVRGLAWTHRRTPCRHRLWWKPPTRSRWVWVRGSSGRPTGSRLWCRGGRRRDGDRTPPSRQPKNQRSRYYFCSTGLPLTRTRWVWSTFSSHCTLSSNQRWWLTSATLIIFLLKKFQECWKSNPGLLGEKQVCYLCAMQPPP